MINHTLWLAQSSGRAFIQIRGKGTYKNACLLKESTQLIINQGIKNFTIDFNNCTGLDSTFLGVLAGLALESRQLNGELALINLQQRNLELIENMGMNSLIRVSHDTNLPKHSLSFEPIKEQISTKPQTTKTMIEAHEALIKIHEGNRPQFQNVIECLHESEKKQNNFSKSFSVSSKCP